MIIKENFLLSELENIFEGNNQNFICDKDCIFDDTFLKVVAVESGHAVGYAVVYIGNDFIQKENYPLDLTIKKNSAYIWNCVTKKGFENKGIQTEIFNYIKNKFSHLDIYSVIDITNIPTTRLHNKIGFKEVVNFSKKHKGVLAHYKLLLLENSKKEMIN